MVEQAGQLAAEGAPLRISPRLVVAIVLVGLALIVWVARSAMAQNTPKDPPTASPRAVTPSPASPSTAVGVPLPSAEPLPPVDSAPTRSLADSRSLFELDPGSLHFAAGETDDPENYAQTFVERNRRVAEAQLKSLKDEAEKLRAPPQARGGDPAMGGAADGPAGERGCRVGRGRRGTRRASPPGASGTGADSQAPSPIPDTNGPAAGGRGPSGWGPATARAQDRPASLLRFDCAGRAG